MRRVSDSVSFSRLSSLCSMFSCSSWRRNLSRSPIASSPAELVESFLQLKPLNGNVDSTLGDLRLLVDKIESTVTFRSDLIEGTPRNDPALEECHDDEGENR